MRVWRICLPRYEIFNGEGARRYGGRWNQPGTSLVYTSGSLSLAALELFVHVEADLAPTRLVAVAAEIPDTLEMDSIDATELPRNWRAYPPPETLKNIGATWVAANTTAVLAVPSAVIPEEYNYLLNPRHPQFRRLRILKPIPFRFDLRMWK